MQQHHILAFEIGGFLAKSCGAADHGGADHSGERNQASLSEDFLEAVGIPCPKSCVGWSALAPVIPSLNTSAASVIDLYTAFEPSHAKATLTEQAVADEGQATAVEH